MTPVRRTVLFAALAVAGAALLWGPAYARALALVVRAAEIDGWLQRAAELEARSWSTDGAFRLPTRHGAISARLYRPAGPVDRAAVLTPGVHAMGIDEPRLQRLAGELAASGIAVLTIALPDLVRYRFSLDAVDQIEDAAIWLSAHDDLAPDGRVGLMGVSFAGGLTVVAAGRPGLRDRVAFTFSFGGHGDLPRTLGRVQGEAAGSRLVGTTSNPEWYVRQLAAVRHPFRVVGGPEVRAAARDLAARLAAAVGDAGDVSDAGR